MALFNALWGRGSFLSGMLGKAAGITSNSGAVVSKVEGAAGGLGRTAEDIIRLTGSTGEQATHIRKIMADSAGGIVGAAKDEAQKGGFKTFLKSAGVLLGIGGAAVGTGALQSAATAIYTQNANSEKIAGTKSAFTGFYQVLASILDMLGIKGTKFNDWLDKKLEPAKDGVVKTTVSEVGDKIEGIVPDALDKGNSLAATAELGVAGLGAYFLGKRALGGGAAAAAPAVVAAEGAAVGGLASKLAGKGGKFAIFAGVTAAGLGAWNMLTGEGEANAAIDPTADIALDEAPVETSMDETLAVGGTAVVAAKTLGAKAIPVLGGVLTAYDTLKETGGYVWEGEFEKAGTSLVAGAGLTVGATGGFLTYGLGEAWHAAVRDGAEYALGNDAKIAKAPLRSLFEAATGLETDMNKTSTPAPAIASANDKTAKPWVEYTMIAP